MVYLSIAWIQMGCRTERLLPPPFFPVSPYFFVRRRKKRTTECMKRRTLRRKKNPEKRKLYPTLPWSQQADFERKCFSTFKGRLRGIGRLRGMGSSHSWQRRCQWWECGDSEWQAPPGSYSSVGDGAERANQQSATTCWHCWQRRQCQWQGGHGERWPPTGATASTFLQGVHW